MSLVISSHGSVSERTVSCLCSCRPRSRGANTLTKFDIVRVFARKRPGQTSFLSSRKDRNAHATRPCKMDSVCVLLSCKRAKPAEGKICLPAYAKIIFAEPFTPWRVSHCYVSNMLAPAPNRFLPAAGYPNDIDSAGLITNWQTASRPPWRSVRVAVASGCSPWRQAGWPRARCERRRRW